MESTIECEFTYEEIQRNPSILKNIKILSRDPDACKDMMPGDIFDVRYGMSVSFPDEGIVDRLQAMQALDPAKFDTLELRMLLNELKKLTARLAEFEEFVNKLEGDE